MPGHAGGRGGVCHPGPGEVPPCPRPSGGGGLQPGGGRASQDGLSLAAVLRPVAGPEPVRPLLDGLRPAGAAVQSAGQFTVQPAGQLPGLRHHAAGGAHPAPLLGLDPRQVAAGPAPAGRGGGEAVLVGGPVPHLGGVRQGLWLRHPHLLPLPALQELPGLRRLRGPALGGGGAVHPPGQQGLAGLRLCGRGGRRPVPGRTGDPPVLYALPPGPPHRGGVHRQRERYVPLCRPGEVGPAGPGGELRAGLAG